jgi:hypothetical protein
MGNRGSAQCPDSGGEIRHEIHIHVSWRTRESSGHLNIRTPEPDRWEGWVSQTRYGPKCEAPINFARQIWALAPGRRRLHIIILCEWPPA